jgi:hypothetical protein
MFWRVETMTFAAISIVGETISALVIKYSFLASAAEQMRHLHLMGVTQRFFLDAQILKHRTDRLSRNVCN